MWFFFKFRVKSILEKIKSVFENFFLDIHIYFFYLICFSEKYFFNFTFENILFFFQLFINDYFLKVTFRLSVAKLNLSKKIA